jgi:hypothetical protein
MLNKKSAFKPKAAVRRPGPVPPTQGSQRPSTTNGSTATTPAPQELSSQPPAPAPHSIPAEKDVLTTSQVQDKEVETASTIQSQKASVVSTLTVTSTKGTDNTSTTQPTEPSSSKSAEAEPVHVPIQYWSIQPRRSPLLAIRPEMRQNLSRHLAFRNQLPLLTKALLRRRLRLLRQIPYRYLRLLKLSNLL